METVKNEQVNKQAESAGNKKKVPYRIITAAVYVVVWIGLCALKWTVPQGWGALGFDAIFCAISIISAFEFLRAIDKSEKVKISFPQRAFTLAFCAVSVPLYVVVQLTMQEGFLATACSFCVYIMFLAATSVFDHYKSTVKGTIYCVFCMIYCGVLSMVLSSINHLAQNSMAAILVLFMCTALTDTGAYVIGTLFKRWVPFKLAPQLSPNKTVIGAVGGIIGGIVGAILAYYVMYLCGGLNGEIAVWGMNNVYLTFSSEKIHPLVTFIILGLFTAILSQVGDLFESAIKRECGVKDMGNLLPGHGGVLDRFDSMLYSSVLVLFCFGTIII